MYVDNPFKSPAILSFCPGILGIERGLARAGVHCRVATYVEIEAFIIANLVAGMEAGLLDPAPIWTDAKTFDARPFRGRIHGIIGGYPCPGESLAGLREGHLYKGFIWPAIRRAIDAVRPLWCFFENVDGHLTGTYPIVQRSLRNMGYSVEAGVYSAAEVGAPHDRKRLFILAVENSLKLRMRRGINEGTYRGCEIQATGSGELGHTKYKPVDSSIGGLWRESNSTSNEMANSHESGFRGINSEGLQPEVESNGIMADSGYAGHGLVTEDEHQGFEPPERPKELLSGDQLADKLRQGLAERKEQSARKEQPTTKRSGGVWPARPGHEQHYWEQPRTIITDATARLLGGYGKKYPESFSKEQIDQVAFDGFTGTIKPGLDSTINGYNFREDFLRALGNSVVEQQAEVAFLGLMEKHGLSMGGDKVK